MYANGMPTEYTPTSFTGFKLFYASRVLGTTKK